MEEVYDVSDSSSSDEDDHMSENVAPVVSTSTVQHPPSSRLPLATISNHSPSDRIQISKPQVVKKSEVAVAPPSAKKLKLRHSWTAFREFVRSAPLTNAAETRLGLPSGKTPLPPLNWVDRNELWELMCKKEGGMYRRAAADRVLAQHPALHARMRAVLFDWLIEVCEVYRMHRETFYLAVDFIDRYLSKTRDIPKTRLQLIGKSVKWKCVQKNGDMVACLLQQASPASSSGPRSRRFTRRSCQNSPT